MATFNGLEIVPLPASPAVPASIEFTAMDAVAVSTNPFAAQQQVQDGQASWRDEEGLGALVINPHATSDRMAPSVHVLFVTS